MSLKWLHVAKALLVVLSCIAGTIPALAGEGIQVQPGTEVRLKLVDALSSDNVYKGQVFRMDVVEDVRVQGLVVIPKGTPAHGIVLRAQSSGALGRPGALNLRIQSLLLDGRRIPLYSGIAKKNKDSDGAAVVMLAAFGPLGMLVRGKAVKIEAGTEVLAYVDAPFEAKPVLAMAPAPDTSTESAEAAQPDSAPSQIVPAPEAALPPATEASQAFGTTPSRF